MGTNSVIQEWAIGPFKGSEVGIWLIVIVNVDNKRVAALAIKTPTWEGGVDPARGVRDPREIIAMALCCDLFGYERRDTIKDTAHGATLRMKPPSSTHESGSKVTVCSQEEPAHGVQTMIT